MSKTEEFLSAKEEQELIEAIKLAEKNTSGEIRVHLEKKSSLEPFDRAKEIFYLLKMNETEHQNGVLFYVAVEDKKFTILGDKGINDVVPNSFWNSIKNMVIKNFQIGKYSEGLKLGIIETGIKLKEYFPYQNDDKNELPDSISLS
jgi:uncharacterized membrane protein